MLLTVVPGRASAKRLRNIVVANLCWQAGPGIWHRLFCWRFLLTLFYISALVYNRRCAALLAGLYSNVWFAATAVGLPTRDNLIDLSIYALLLLPCQCSRRRRRRRYQRPIQFHLANASKMSWIIEPIRARWLMERNTHNKLGQISIPVSSDHSIFDLDFRHQKDHFRVFEEAQRPQWNLTLLRSVRYIRKSFLGPEHSMAGRAP